MEAELLQKLIASGGGVYFLYFLVKKLSNELKSTREELRVMHKEGVTEVRGLTQAVESLKTMMAVHDQKFDHGEERMDRLENRLEVVAVRTHKLSNDSQVAKLQLSVLKEQVTSLMEHNKE